MKEAYKAWWEMHQRMLRYGVRRSLSVDSPVFTSAGGMLSIMGDLQLDGERQDIRIEITATRAQKVTAVAWMDVVDEDDKVVDLIFVLLTDRSGRNGQGFAKKAPPNKALAPRE